MNQHKERQCESKVSNSRIYKVQCTDQMTMGWIQDFREEGLRSGPAQAVSCMGSGCVIFQKILKIVVLGNGILRLGPCILK